MIKKFFSILQGIFGTPLEKFQEDDVSHLRQDALNKAEIRFKSISVKNKTPRNDSISERDFTTVVYKGKPIWALFQCPCGCGCVISLSLQTMHSPHWRVKKSKAGRPTLLPSVWQKNGCCSHFLIEDGRMLWCNNTGTSPGSRPGLDVSI